MMTCYPTILTATQSVLLTVTCILFFVQVKVGDTLDLVLSENRDANTVTVMRVVLKKVLGDTTKTEKYKVSLRRWKFLESPADEAFKP